MKVSKSQKKMAKRIIEILIEKGFIQGHEVYYCAGVGLSKPYYLFSIPQIPKNELEFKLADAIAQAEGEIK